MNVSDLIDAIYQIPGIVTVQDAQAVLFNADHMEALNKRFPDLTQSMVDRAYDDLEGQNEPFRFNHESGEVYHYARDRGFYVFCGHLNGRSEADFVADFKRSVAEQLMDGGE